MRKRRQRGLIVAPTKAGKTTVLKAKTPLIAGEIIDAAVMSRKALRAFFAEQIEAAKKDGILFSLHVKATMMKIADPIVFGHAVSVFFADVIEKHVALRKGHVTTRQNIQMHHIPLPDAAELIRELGDAGLSSREGCGNTMRNVTGDPRAGTLDGEVFEHLSGGELTVTLWLGRRRGLKAVKAA